MSNLRPNLVFAFIYNVACIPIAAKVVYPTFGLLLSTMIAAAAMALSSVSVIAYALLRETSERPSGRTAQVGGRPASANHGPIH